MDHAEHQIAEREARWWGYLIYAHTDAYEGQEYRMEGPKPEQGITQRFLDYTLQNRMLNARYRLVLKPWPESGFVETAAA